MILATVEVRILLSFLIFVWNALSCLVRVELGLGFWNSVLVMEPRFKQRTDRQTDRQMDLIIDNKLEIYHSSLEVTVAFLPVKISSDRRLHLPFEEADRPNN